VAQDGHVGVDGLDGGVAAGMKYDWEMGGRVRCVPDSDFIM